jgi:hypothetical protein
MKTVKPDITDIDPPAPIVIDLPAGQVFGESGILQLQVNLELAGGPPSTVIASLEILSPQLYLFTDNRSKKRFSIQMTAPQMAITLEFQIKNLAFFPGTQPKLDLGVFTWDQETGENFKDSDFASITVSVVRPVRLRFKQFK